MDLKFSPLNIQTAKSPNAFIIKGENSFTYKSFYDRVLKYAHQLKESGVKKGDKIACCDYNILDIITIYFAAIEIEAIFFPISPKFPKKQIIELLNLYDVNIIYSSIYEFDLKMFNIIESEISFIPNKISYKDPCNIVLTSGSSGMPKAALHNLNNHIASAKGSLTMIPMIKTDSWLLSLPLYHIGGIAVLNRCVFSGARIILANPKTKILTQIMSENITHLSLVATQLEDIIKEKYFKFEKLKNVKSILLGGGAIPSKLLLSAKPIEDKLYTSYGLTEMSSQVATMRLMDKKCYVLPYRKIKLIKNRIYVKGETLFLGYLLPTGEIDKSIDEEGWFDTKDLGTYENNNLKVIGRADNMFISGGENIHPEEIEEILKQHPSIDDAIVFPFFDEKFQNLPAAIIKGTFNINDLEEFILARLAGFKRPRKYYMWPETEDNHLKVQRRKIIFDVLKKNDAV